MEPSWWADKMMKVATPTTDVTKVEAKVAGATFLGDRPAPTRTGARMDPPPMPWIPPTTPTTAARAAAVPAGRGSRGASALGLGRSAGHDPRGIKTAV